MVCHFAAGGTPRPPRVRALRHEHRGVSGQTQSTPEMLHRLRMRTATHELRGRLRIFPCTNREHAIANSDPNEGNEAWGREHFHRDLSAQVADGFYLVSISWLQRRDAESARFGVLAGRDAYRRSKGKRTDSVGLHDDLESELSRNHGCIEVSIN